MLCIHFLQQWFNLSDPAMEETLSDTPMFREFSGLDVGKDHMPDENTILRFRHLLEAHHLSIQILSIANATMTAKGLLLNHGTVVDATLIVAPSSTKNSTGTRDLEMHQTQKGHQWHHGMKAHIGLDADQGLVHSVKTTAANEHDVTRVLALLQVEESDVCADSGDQVVEKRKEIQAKHPQVIWRITMLACKRRAIDKSTSMGAISENLEKTKASIRAKIEHPFRALKRQFSYVKVKYRGQAKNTAKLMTLYSLPNIWMVRKRLLNTGTQA